MNQEKEREISSATIVEEVAFCLDGSPKKLENDESFIFEPH